MPVDPDRLTEVLAQRFDEVTPDGIHVTADDGMLWYSSDFGRGKAGSYVRYSLAGAAGESDEADLVSTTVIILDQLQDFVSEATTDPWPGTGRQPEPQAEIRDGALHLWYGDPGDIKLAIAPIDTADLIS
jgi:hypothetical protein